MLVHFQWSDAVNNLMRKAMNWHPIINILERASSRFRIIIRWRPEVVGNFGRPTTVQQSFFNAIMIEFSGPQITVGL